jgi:hypothetical protein
MNNFHCSDCAYNFHVAQYSISIKDKKPLYLSKIGKKVICPKCNSEEIEPIEKDGDFSTLKLGKYSMQSIEGRQESLKKRSHKHFVEHIKDKQFEINRNPGLQMLE